MYYKGNLDPWLHEGANTTGIRGCASPADLDPWLHEGANANRYGTRPDSPDLDPWLHEGANAVAMECLKAASLFRSMAPRGSQLGVSLGLRDRIEI